MHRFCDESGALRRVRKGGVWDLCAAGLSTICILHCLLLPLLVTVLPMVSQFSDNHDLHVILVMLAAPVTLWVIWGVITSEEDGRLFTAVALTGLGTMVVAVAIPEVETLEIALTLTGGVLLGGAHLWRWFQHRPVS